MRLASGGSPHEHAVCGGAHRVSQGRSGIACPGTVVLRQFADTRVSTISAIFVDQSTAIFADYLLLIFADFILGGGWRLQGCYGYCPTMPLLPTGTSSQAHHFDEFNS